MKVDNDDNEVGEKEEERGKGDEEEKGKKRNRKKEMKSNIARMKGKWVERKMKKENEEEKKGKKTGRKVRRGSRGTERECDMGGRRKKTDRQTIHKR